MLILYTGHVIGDIIRKGVLETLHSIAIKLEIPVNIFTVFHIFPDAGTCRVSVLGLIGRTEIDLNIFQREVGIVVHDHKGHGGLVLDFVIGIGNRGVATSSEQSRSRGEGQEFMFHTFSL